MKRLCILSLALLLAACGSTTVNDAGDIGDRTTYPDGPYGRQPGAILDNLAFRTADGQTLTLHDLRSDESLRVLLVNSMAEWCQPCIQEQPDLVALQKEFGERGFLVLGAMFENNDYDTPNAQDITDWNRLYSVNFQMVIDDKRVLTPFYQGNPPMNMVVDVDTMEILSLGAGFDKNVIRTLIDSNLPR